MSQLSHRTPESAFDVESECDSTLRSIQRLRDEVVRAWQDRAVLLTKSEQAQLHAEIKRTCQLLTDLTDPRHD